ncbi:MAG: hypothetical protein Q9213_007880, partial [Squamulea squamosa]
MSPAVASAKLTLTYPLWASDFDPQNNNFLLVGGGGGEGRSGVGNKIVMFSGHVVSNNRLTFYQTLINSSRKQSISEVVDIDLSKDEDSVSSLAVSSSTPSSVTAFAGINSSQKDQDAGKNEHLRSFRLEYPPQPRHNGGEGQGAGAQMYKGQTAALGRASLFTPRTPSTSGAYQRITRLSRPSKINGGQLGAIATGFAPKGPEGEIVLFDAKTNGPMGPWVEARLPLGKRKVNEKEKGIEAADVDVIGLDDNEESSPGTFAVAYCTDYEVYTFSVTLKQNTAPEPRFAYGEPHPDVFISHKTRPEFRSLRFITPRLVLLLQNRANRSGADLLLLELSSSFHGKIIGRKGLHRGIKTATELSVTHLSSSSTSQPNQLVAAVAGQDTSISIFTLKYADRAPYKSPKIRHHILLRSVHPQIITSLSFSTFSPPEATASSALPQYLKLASTSIAGTVVVHTFPLIPYPPLSQQSAKRRYVLTPPGRGDAATIGISILVSALAIALGAFFLQAFTEIRGASPEYLGAKGWLSQRVHDYIAVPYILENGTSIAPSTTAISSFSEHASLSSSSITDQVTNTLADIKTSVSDSATAVKEILYDTPEEAKAAVSSALDAASSAASELKAASEAYSATAASPISSLSSSASSKVTSGSHHVRDLLSRHFNYRQHQSPDSDIHHMVIGDGENGKLKAGFYRPGTEGSDTEVKKFEDLSKREKEIWKQRLREAGVWAVDEGEA